MNTHSLSIVVPLGPDEPQWPPLLDQLTLLPVGSEVLLVGHDQMSAPPQLSALPPTLGHLRWQWLTAPRGRASQLNAGAAVARGDYLWFLHADTLLRRDNLSTLLRQMARHDGALFYFDLYFADKGSRRLKINEWGARLRSDWLGVPFGDQGFCLRRADFQRLGGYDEIAAYGEDHLLVWAARHQGLTLRRCPVPLATSARKYRRHGWGRLTLRYQWLWLRQAAIPMLRLVKIKLLGRQ